MPFGYNLPARANSATNKRLRRIGTAISSGSGSTATPIESRLFAGEYFLITTQQFDTVPILHIKNDTTEFDGMGFEFNFVTTTGPQFLVTIDGTETLFKADSNGVKWFYQHADVSGTGNEPALDTWSRATAANTEFDLDFAAATSRRDGNWMIITDAGANASSGPIDITIDGDETPDTINNLTNSLKIYENNMGVLLMQDETAGNWAAFELTPYYNTGNPKRAPVLSVTNDDVTLDSSHHTVRMNPADAVNVTVTLPPAADSPGRIYAIKKVDATAATVTIDGNGSETIDGATTQVISTQYDSLMVHCNGSSWDIIASH